MAGKTGNAAASPTPNAAPNTGPKITPIAERIFLWLILAVTFILSIKQLYPFDSVDELEIMYWIEGLHNKPFPALSYPPLFVYLHYLLSVVYGWVLSFLGITGGGDFVLTDMGFRFTLEAGRLLNACFTTLLVYVVFRTGKDFYNKAVGFLAALLMAVNGLVLLYAHIFKPEILVTLLTATAFYFTLKALDSPGIRPLLTASFFYGLSVATKYNVFPLVLVLLLALFWNRGKHAAANGKKEWFKGAAFIFLGAAAGFLAGSPNWVVHPILNIKQFFGQYAADGGNLYQQFRAQSALDIYGGFFMDFLTTFGPVFFVLFIAGAGWGLFKRNRADILALLWLVSYIVLFAFFGYYADRFGLPLYPVVALMAAKVIFFDLPHLLKGKLGEPKLRIILPVLWVPLLIFGGVRTAGNLETYNLLKTQNETDRTIEYREVHGIADKRFNVGRQLMTPRVYGKNIKLNKRFHLKFANRDGRKKLHFIQAHLTSYREFLESGAGKDPQAVSLENHRPFYFIEKHPYQPFTPECVFLYHLSPQLRNVKPGTHPDSSGLFPRAFYRNRHTIFLPLQTYEKNPNSGQLKQAAPFRRRIYSRKPIAKIRFHIFSPTKAPALRLQINNTGTETAAWEKRDIKDIAVENLTRKSLYHDYVYCLDIRPQAQSKVNAAYYFTWAPVYREETPQPNQSLPVLSAPLEGGIPFLFSNAPYPGWVKEFYEKTGIDLPLLDFTGTHTLYDNPEKSIEDIAIPYFPLEKGPYILRVYGGKLVEGLEISESKAALQLKVFGASGDGRIDIPLTAPPPGAFPIRIAEPTVFVDIRAKGLRQNNYLVNKITITPDYRQLAAR